MGNYYLKQATTTPALSYTETSVVAGKTYSFKISAVNIVGEGNLSSSIEIIAAYLPSTPPTPTYVSADSSPQITIQWGAPAYDGGSPIVNYRVYMDNLFVGQTAGGVLTYTKNTGLTVGNTYTFKVSAVNAIGESSLSGGVAIIAAQVPSAPDLPTKKSASASFIEPQWLAPNNGGSPILGYRIYKDGTTIAGTLETNAATLSLVITDSIVPGTNYSIQVAAYNAVGEGARSTTLTIMAAAIPEAPTGITLVSQSATAIQISWTAPYNGGTAITTYKIWWDNGLGGLPATFIEKIGSTGVVLTFNINSGVVTDTVYQLAIKATNVIGDGPLSTAITVRAASIPNTPAAPTKQSSTTSSITIQWVAPTYNGGNALTKYSVYMDDGLGGAVNLLASTADATILSY